jgi:hypothetical protein
MRSLLTILIVLSTGTAHADLLLKVEDADLANLKDSLSVVGSLEGDSIYGKGVVFQTFLSASQIQDPNEKDELIRKIKGICSQVSRLAIEGIQGKLGGHLEIYVKTELKIQPGNNGIYLQCAQVEKDKK